MSTLEGDELCKKFQANTIQLLTQKGGYIRNSLYFYWNVPTICHRPVCISPLWCQVNHKRELFSRGGLTCFSTDGQHHMLKWWLDMLPMHYIKTVKFRAHKIFSCFMFRIASLSKWISFTRMECSLFSICRRIIEPTTIF